MTVCFVAPAEPPLYPVLDGPLRGEAHNQGDRFRYDGALIGSENGTYYLLDGEYFWQADRDVIKIRPE